MDARFRLGGRRRAKPPAVLAGDGDFAPAIFPMQGQKGTSRKLRFLCAHALTHERYVRKMLFS